MISAVFDCMVFLQAAINVRGPAFACLELVESRHVQLYVSAAILSEVRDVLTRPELQSRFPHLTTERADIFVQKVATMAVLENDVADAGVTLRDPDDLPYLNLAVFANAAYIVSRDKDMLALMSDSTFTATWPQMQVVDPVTFLKVVRAAQTP
jgi:uncharacterized protein